MDFKDGATVVGDWYLDVKMDVVDVVVVDVVVVVVVEKYEDEDEDEAVEVEERKCNEGDEDEHGFERKVDIRIKLTEVRNLF